jgi:hypothetical protein
MNSGTSVTSHDPHFFPVTSSAFLRDQIEDLAAGRCAAIRVPDLLPSAVCRRVLEALTDREFQPYGTRRVYPPVMRFGIGVSDHRKDGQVADSYWTALGPAREEWQSLDLPFDPFRLCREALGAHWPSPVSVGRRGDREMGAGVAREPNQGFQVHFDDARREFTGNLLDADLVAQFAFNLYLSVPTSGGETVIWRHRWRPSDEEFRLPQSYGYAEDVVGGAEWFELKPRVGEALLFDPRNFHAVRPSHDQRRIALGFSVGLSDTGELLTWG